MCRYAHALELSHAQIAELAALLRGHVPPVADAAIEEVERQMPALVRPHDPQYAEFLGQAVRRGIGYSVDHMLDGDGRIEG